MRESTIERYLVRKVKAAGGECYKFVSPGRKNVPDRLCVFPGARLCFVELKAPGETASAAQLREHGRLWRLGIPAHVADAKVLVDYYVSLYGGPLPLAPGSKRAAAAAGPAKSRPAV